MGILGSSNTVYTTAAITPTHGSDDGGDIILATRPTEVAWDPTKYHDTLTPFVGANWTSTTGIAAVPNGTTLTTFISGVEATLRHTILQTACDSVVTLQNLILAGKLQLADIIIGSLGHYIDVNNFARIEVFINATTPLSVRLVTMLGGQSYKSPIYRLSGYPVTLHLRRIGSKLWAWAGAQLLAFVPGWALGSGVPELRVFTQSTPAPTTVTLFSHYFDLPMLLNGMDIAGTSVGDFTTQLLQFITAAFEMASNIPVVVHTTGFDCQIVGGYTYDPDNLQVLASDGRSTLSVPSDITLRSS